MKPLILTDEAEQGVMLISINIEFNFSRVRALKFEAELRAALNRLCQNPNRWPVDRIKDGIPVRKYIFQEKTIVLYSEREEFISIDVIADARTDWQVKP